MARTPKNVTFDETASAEIVRLRDDEGYKWDQISGAVNMPVGKAMLIYNFAKTPKKLRIKDATGQDIARLRDDEHLSWGQISARTGYPEGSCRSLYEEATGNSAKGNSIGKGGRKPGDGAGVPKAPKGSKAKAEKPAKEAKPGKLDGLTDEEIKESLEGHAIKVASDSGDAETLKVKSVKKVQKGKVVLVTADGQARTIKAAAVVAISAKKFVKS